MLKFVSTKPPRGRSQSGLMTPDRDIIVRYTSHSESSPRIPPSPRVPSSPKSGKRSQAYTYPSSRGVQATPKSFSPGYKTVHFSGAGNTASSSRDAQKHGEASSDFRSLRYPEQYYQHNVSKQRQLQQQQPQQHPALPQQQNIEPPWPFQNGFHGSTSFPSHHGSTQFAPRTMPKPDTSTHLGATQPQPLGATQPQPLGSSLNAIRSNHRTHDRLSFNTETHTGQPSFYDIQKAKTLPKNSHIPTIISRDAENSLYPGDSKHQLKDIREPVKINCQYTRDIGHKGGATPTGGSDYDLAKPIIESQMQIDTSQAAGQKTTQYIIEESLTKRRLSETYIPPPGSGVTPYTVERLVTEQAPPAGLRKFERSQTTGLRETGPFNATPEGLPVGTHQVCVSNDC